MVIEWLKIQVSPELREKYIQVDEEIWTAALAQHAGFLGKQVWIDPRETDKVIFVIQWASREAWKAIPAAELTEIDRQFAQKMGTDAYKIIEEGEYQVRKFPQAAS